MAIYKITLLVDSNDFTGTLAGKRPEKEDEQRKDIHGDQLTIERNIVCVWNKNSAMVLGRVINLTIE